MPRPVPCGLSIGGAIVLQLLLVVFSALLVELGRIPIAFIAAQLLLRLTFLAFQRCLLFFQLGQLLFGRV